MAYRGLGSAQRSCVCGGQLPISNSSRLNSVGPPLGKSCAYSAYEMQGWPRSLRLLRYRQTGAGGTVGTSGWDLIWLWSQTDPVAHRGSSIGSDQGCDTLCTLLNL